jgi:hypothetical protein
MDQLLIDKVAEYPLLNEAEIADILNSPDASLPKKKIKTDSGLIRGILFRTGEWLVIKKAINNTELSDDLRNMCEVIIDSLMYTENLHTDNPVFMATIQFMMDTIETAGLISPNTNNEIISLGEVQQSWAEYNNIIVNSRIVGLARGAKE